MTANFWQLGKTIDYKNETTDIIPAGTVVALKTRVGIAGTEIAPGELGSLNMEGVFEMAKTSASEVIEMGDNVVFDGTGISLPDNESESSQIPAGYAAAVSDASTATVLVKLIG